MTALVLPLTGGGRQCWSLECVHMYRACWTGRIACWPAASPGCLQSCTAGTRAWRRVYGRHSSSSLYCHPPWHLALQTVCLLWALLWGWRSRLRRMRMRMSPSHPRLRRLRQAAAAQEERRLWAVAYW